MTPEEEVIIQDSLILAIKELGEIAACLVKADARPDHWKNELCDLCGLAIHPMLEAAGVTYHDAWRIGVARKQQKIGETK